MLKKRNSNEDGQCNGQVKKDKSISVYWLCYCTIYAVIHFLCVVICSDFPLFLYISISVLQLDIQLSKVWELGFS